MMRTRHIAALCALAALTAAQPASARPLPRRVLASDLVIDDVQPASGFSYQWSLPARAGLYPALVGAMRSEAQVQLRNDRAEATANRQAGGQSGRTWWRSADWQLGADAPRLLNLWVAETQVGSGTRANLTYKSRWWDKQAGRMLDLDDLAQDSAQALQALTPAFCSAIASQQAMKRGDRPVDLAAYKQCPSLAEQVLVPQILGADRRIALFSVKVAPGNAGPRAEGSYEITIPVNAAFISVLKPEWQSSFRAP